MAPLHVGLHGGNEQHFFERLLLCDSKGSGILASDDDGKASLSLYSSVVRAVVVARAVSLDGGLVDGQERRRCVHGRRR